MRLASVSYARPKDINPVVPTRLLLKDRDGTGKKVEQLDFNAGILLPGSPVHRKSPFGTTQKAEASALRGGVQIGVVQSDVTFNEMTEKPTIRHQIGVTAHITEGGNVTGKATTFSGGMPYASEVIDLSHTHSAEGGKIMRAVRGILLGKQD